MSRFETTFRNAVANAERDVLVVQIRANSQMSLHELGKLATGELGALLKQITVGDLVGGAGAGAGASEAAAPEARQGARPGRKPKAEGRKAGGKQEVAAPAKKQAEGGRKAAAAEVDTRTAEGRAAYDQAVLTALRAATGPQSASDLTAVAGGSPLQIRTALARLIEAGSVHWSGRARGTRYTPA